MSCLRPVVGERRCTSAHEPIGVRSDASAVQQVQRAQAATETATVSSEQAKNVLGRAI